MNALKLKTSSSLQNIKENSIGNIRETKSDQEIILIDEDDVDKENTFKPLKRTSTVDEQISNVTAKRSKLNHVGGSLVFENDQNFKNEQFGTMVSITELFNNYMKLYEMYSEDTELIRISSIEFNKLKDALVHDKFQTDSYLLKIVETLFRLIVKNNSFYSRCIMYNLSFRKFVENMYDPMCLQELCRILVNIDSNTEFHVQDENDVNDEDNVNGRNQKFSLLKVSVQAEPQTDALDFNGKLLKSLNETELSDFTIEMRLDLIKFLCYRFINLEIVSDFMHKLESKVETCRNNCLALKPDYNYLKSSTLVDINNNLEKEKIESIAKKLEKCKKEFEEAKRQYQNCVRLNSLGKDGYNNIYWIFDCIKNKLYREHREINEECDSFSVQWFEYDLTKDDIGALCSYLHEEMDESRNTRELIARLNVLKVDNQSQMESSSSVESISSKIAKKQRVKKDSTINNTSRIFKMLHEVVVHYIKDAAVYDNNFYLSFKDQIEDYSSQSNQVAYFKSCFEAFIENINLKRLKKSTLGGTIKDVIGNSHTSSSIYFMLIILKENIKSPTDNELICYYCSENATRDIRFFYKTCSECVRPYHNDCILKMHGEINGEWICKSCNEEEDITIIKERTKRKNQEVELQSIECSNYRLRRLDARVEQQKPKKARIVEKRQPVRERTKRRRTNSGSEDDEFYPVRMSKQEEYIPTARGKSLRQRKSVNYCE